MPLERPTSSRPTPRIGVVDAARGAALIGMMAFHVDWDLAELGWIGVGPADSPAWGAFGQIVAASFLFLSGFGLVLAAPKGTRAALRRLGVIAGAAMVVTAATWLLFPESVIGFGILHCIAVTNALALSILGWPSAALLGIAAVAALAPAAIKLPALDGPIGWWTGLAPTLPHTLDHRPVLPWLAVVLLGVVAGRIRPAWSAGHVRGAPVRWLAWLGRHSLSIYLVHQPLLFGALLAWGAVVGPPARDTAAFERRCRSECVAAGAEATLCESACACAATAWDERDRFGRRRPAGPQSLRDAGLACGTQ